MSTICLVRPGECDNDVGIVNYFDSELSYNGCKQAHKAANWIRKNLPEPYSLAGYCSPYMRCLQTGMAIGARIGIRFMVRHNLAPNQNTGDLVQINARTGLLGHDVNYDHVQLDGGSWGWRYINYNDGPGVYSERLNAFIKTLPHRAVVVTHATVIKDIIKRITGQEPKDIYHGSISLIEDKHLVFSNLSFYAD